MKKQLQAGFTLIEIALALLVAGLGVIGVFALFPQAMDASRRSQDATEMSAFADFVFDGLEYQARDTGLVWTAFAVNTARVNPTDAWVTNLEKIVIASNRVAEVYDWMPSYYGASGGGAESVPNMGLYVTTTNYSAATFTYTLDVGAVAGSVAKYGRLEVWPGNRMGPVNQSLAAGSNFPGGIVFYREFLPPY